jgi:hypothetical protein
MYVGYMLNDAVSRKSKVKNKMPDINAKFVAFTF